MKKHATIIGIAEALNISKSTVSRALADGFNVKPETKEAVLAMAKEMHYKPNPYARNLTKQRTKIIGVVVPEFVNSFFPRIIIEIQNYFAQYEYNVLITQSNESAEIERKNLQLLEANMVEGVIISMAENGINTDYYQEIINNGTPMVFFNRIPERIEVDSVVIDDYVMSVFAMEKLIVNGDTKRKKIMYLKGPKSVNASEKRYQGYVKGLSKYRIDLDESFVVECEHFDRQTGYESVLKSIDKGVIPEGIFAFNDQLAIGAIRALKERGYRVPFDTAVMGFSESQSALLIDPPLSSVAQPLEEMGQTAAKMLLEKIENPDMKSRKIVLAAKINVRESSDITLAAKYFKH